MLNRSKRLTDTSSYIEIDKSKIEKELIEIHNNLACLDYVGKEFKTYKNAYLDGILSEKLYDEKMGNAEFNDEAIDIANKYIGQECYKRKYSM